MEQEIQILRRSIAERKSKTVSGQLLLRIESDGRKIKLEVLNQLLEDDANIFATIANYFGVDIENLKKDIVAGDLFVDDLPGNIKNVYLAKLNQQA